MDEDANIWVESSPSCVYRCIGLKLYALKFVS